MHKRWSVLAAAALAVAGSASAQDARPTYKTTQIEPGLYMLEGQGGFTGGNLGLLTGPDGVVLIDDGLEPLADMMLAAVQETAGKPVKFVINTHVHGDHVGGNASMHEHGATIVAHDNVRKRMVESSAAAAALPQMTFSDDVTFHLNGFEAEVMHVRNAHTDGDSMIWYAEANVLQTGDALFNGLYPFIDLESGGSVDGYLAAQARIIDIADEDTRIIPGHGPLATLDDVVASHDMLLDAKARVGKLVDDGLSLEEVQARKPLARYDEDWSWDFITGERMTETLYRALSASD